MKKEDNDFSSTSEKKKVLSPWYIIDKLFLIASLAASSFFCLTGYAGVFMLLFVICFILLIMNISKREKYYISRGKGKGRKNVLLRILVGAVIAGIFLMPFNMRRQWKWFYPVQRSFYISGVDGIFSVFGGSTVGRLFPETIPSDAENYHVRFAPAVMQGSGYANVRYHTDRETIEKYIAKAESECIEKYDFSQYSFDAAARVWTSDDESVNTKRINNWAEIIRNDEEDAANCVVYVYGYFNYNTALAIFNPDTGYCRFCY